MTARAWAAEVQKGTPVRWRGLETAAFEAHDKVLTLLDPSGDYSRGNPGVRRRRRLGMIWTVPLGILLLVLFLVPAYGFAFLMGDRFGRADNDPTTAIHAAGACYAVNVVFLLVLIPAWFVGGRKKQDYGLAGAQAGMALVLGGISVAIAAMRGSGASVSDWPLWSIPIDVTAALGGVFCIMIIIARLRQPRRSTAKAKKERVASDEIATSRRFRRIQEEIARLPAAELAAVRRDLDAAIRDLVARDVISAADGDRAREAELGKLALHMSQRRKPVH